jgi:hypothetical protein
MVSDLGTGKEPIESGAKGGSRLGFGCAGKRQVGGKVRGLDQHCLWPLLFDNLVTNSPELPGWRFLPLLHCLPPPSWCWTRAGFGWGLGARIPGRVEKGRPPLCPPPAPAGPEPRCCDTTRLLALLLSQIPSQQQEFSPCSFTTSLDRYSKDMSVHQAQAISPFSMNRRKRDKGFHDNLVGAHTSGQFLKDHWVTEGGA